jgi:hypothetical protein
LRNVQNHINAVGKENLDFKIVMHGETGLYSVNLNN